MSIRNRRDHDGANRLLFSHREFVADLIRGYAGGSAERALDLRSLTRCNGSYVSPELRQRHCDMVWRVRIRHRWLYVYLLLEFQSTVDRYMAVRLLASVALLWQDLIRQGRAKGGQLPPVLPIVLYNGEKPWRAPVDVASLASPVPEFLAKYQPQARYLFLDQAHAPSSGGLARHNLVSAIFALAQATDSSRRRRLTQALGRWLDGREDLKRAAGTWYLEEMVGSDLLKVPTGTRIAIDRVEPMLTRLKLSIRRRVAAGEARGRAQGRAQGRALGSIQLIARLARSGSLSQDAARAEVLALLRAKDITQGQARAALARLR
jgi:hypothetical protein